MDRRAFLASGAVASVALASGCTSTSPSPAGPDLSTPDARLRAFLQMRGALDDRLVIGFLTGRYYGVVDREPIPLFGIAAATFSRYRRQADGSYVFVLYEQAFFVDLDSGKRLTTWRNPLNDRTVEVPIVRSQPARLVIKPDLVFGHVDAGIPGMTFDHRALGPELQFGDVVFREQAIYSSFVPATGQRRRYSEIVTLRARADDLRDTAAARVRTTVGYASVSAWRPWMEMGDRPGEMLGTGAGGQSIALADMPKPWRDATAETRPEVLDDPGAPLKAVFG